MSGALPAAAVAAWNARDWARAARLLGRAGRDDLMALAYESRGQAGRALRAASRAAARAPRDAGRQLRLAGLAAAAGRDRAALAACRRAARLDPADWRVQRLLAALSGGAERERALRAALAARPDDAEAWRELAAEPSARPAAALAAARVALGRHPGSPQLWSLAASLLERAGEAEAARRALERAARLAPRDAGLAAALAVLRQRAGLEAEALAEAARALRLAPRSAPVLLAAARVEERAGRFARAERLLRAAAARPRSAEALAGLARLALWRGRAGAAARLARRALERGAGPEAWRTLGAAGVFAGRGAAACDALRRALAADPRDHEAAAWLGEAERRAGRARRARALLERALALGNASAGAYAALALAKLELGEPCAAEWTALYGRLPKSLGTFAGPPPYTDEPAVRAALRRALDLAGGNWSGRPTFRAGRRLVRHLHFSPRDVLVEAYAALRHGDPARVLRGLDRALRAAPREAYVHATRGDALLAQGRAREALAAMGRAAALEPRLPWPHAGRCGALILLGDLDSAAAAMERARALGLAEVYGATWQAELARRRGDPAAALELVRRWADPVPFMPAAWLNAALALDDLGDAAGRRRLALRLARGLPGLFRLAGGEPGSRAGLERALALMAGNRSTWLHTARAPGGGLVHLRFAARERRRAPARLAARPWAFAPGDAALAEELERWREAA